MPSLRSCQERSDRHLQEGARRNVIAIENRDQIPLGHAERMIDVARLRVVVVWPDEVAAASRFGEPGELRPPAVVKQVDLELVGRIIHRHRSQDGRLNDVEVFIVGRNEDVDRRPFLGRRRQRNRLAVEGPDHLEVADHQDDPRIHFCGVETIAEHHVERIDEAKRLGGPPPQVPGRYQNRQHDDDQRDHAGFEAIDDEEHDSAEDAEGCLRLKIERRDDDERRQDHPDQRKQQVKKPGADREAGGSWFDGGRSQDLSSRSEFLDWGVAIHVWLQQGRGRRTLPCSSVRDRSPIAGGPRRRRSCRRS